MTTSPLIASLSWGRIMVEGVGTFKDVKLWPGGGREWDWNETGTRHSPGVQPADVAELIDNGAETVVLGRGMQGMLGVAPETLRALEAADVAVEVHESEQAVAVYNRLVGSTAVGALIHSTC